MNELSNVQKYASALSQLRHAYEQAVGLRIGDQVSFAQGLLGPQIETFEELQKELQKVEDMRAVLKDALYRLPESSKFTRRYIQVDEAAGSTWENIPTEWFAKACELVGTNPEIYDV